MGSVCCKDHSGERGELIILYPNIDIENKLRKISAYTYHPLRDTLNDSEYYEFYDTIVECSKYSE
jgi:hypothetical protein